VIDIQASMEEVGPFQNVLILELQYINRLAAFIRTSLSTLRMGFDGKLTMSESMEKLETEVSRAQQRSVRGAGRRGGAPPHLHSI
jgi:hypothetical protein